MRAMINRPSAPPRIPIRYAATLRERRRAAHINAISALADLAGACAKREVVDVVFVYGEYGPVGLTPDEALKLALALRAAQRQ